MNNVSNNSPEETKKTVGQVGSSLAGGLDEKSGQEEQVTNNDLKGKKVDADLTEESEKPADQ